MAQSDFLLSVYTMLKPISNYGPSLIPQNITFGTKKLQNSVHTITIR